MKTILLFTVAFFICTATNVHAQVSGCKDPAATNYNPAATVNDGGCMYNTTTYTPPVKVDPLSSVVEETSGLQMAGGFLWTHNDGGNAAAIYRIDTATNAILQTVSLDGATNVDWEDITFDGTYFYIGDFGNNLDGARTDLKIYKFSFSAIPDYVTNATATIPSSQIEVINFTYSDQVPVTATAPNSTKFDCEALIIDGGQIHLFTKNWIDNNSTHYIINGLTAGTYVATPVETLATGYLVTAASKSPAGTAIVLLGYQASGLGQHFMHILSDFNGGFFFNGNKRRIDLPNAAEMGQGEGITFRNNTYGYISNEYFTRSAGPFTLTVNQKLRSFNIAAFTPMYVLPTNLLSFTVSRQNTSHVINWSFSEPVSNLQLLYSSDQINFSPVQTTAASLKGAYTHLSPAKNSCYKLQWQQANGSAKFSNTVCLNGEEKSGIKNLVLHTDGRLNFTSANEGTYLFKLISTDGRLVKQYSHQAAAGFNQLPFSKSLTAGSTLIVQVIGKGFQNTSLLRVSE